MNSELNLAYEKIAKLENRIEKLNVIALTYSSAIGEIEHAQHKTGHSNSRIEDTLEQLEEDLIYIKKEYDS